MKSKAEAEAEAEADHSDLLIWRCKMVENEGR